MTEEKMTEKESVIKRMLRGFKIMYQKFCELEFVKNAKSEQEADNMLPQMPGELQTDSKGEDPFATDFSKLGEKTDL